MRLIVINHLTALIYIYIYNKPFFTIKIVKSGLNEGFNDSLMNVCFIYERISRTNDSMTNTFYNSHLSPSTGETL